jgi:hypothetical protein
MKQFYRIHIAITILVSVLLSALVNSSSGFAFLCGSFLSGLNVVFIQYAWSRILGKKSVAWPFAVIVLKYTLLIGGIYFIVESQPFPLVWFGVGLGSIMVAAVAYALRLGRQSGKSF